MRDAQDTTWQDRALCAGDASRELDNYFPEGDSFSEILPALEVLAEREAAAKRVCKTPCPVQAECLVFALTNGIEDGIWGGMNPVERDLLLDYGTESHHDSWPTAAATRSRSASRSGLPAPRRGSGTDSDTLAG